MSQPLDRTQEHQPLGAIDTEAGEFWVTSTFHMPRLGHNLSAYETNCLFLNVDGRQFLDASFASHADIDSDSRSVIVTDVNADGAVDILVGSVGGGPLRLFLNRIPSSHHKVLLELKGSRGNRRAIGARVVLRCGSTTITRDLFPANGFMGQSPTPMLIGIGEATTIDRLTIRWPNGETQSLDNVAADQRILVVEGQEGYRSLSF